MICENFSQLFRQLNFKVLAERSLRRDLSSGSCKHSTKPFIDDVLRARRAFSRFSALAQRKISRRHNKHKRTRVLREFMLHSNLCYFIRLLCFSARTYIFMGSRKVFASLVRILCASTLFMPNCFYFVFFVFRSWKFFCRN